MLVGYDSIEQLHQRLGSREVQLSVSHLSGKVFLPLIMALLLHSLLTSTAWAERHHKVLMLYDENTDFPALALLDQSLKAAFKAGTTDRIDFYTESMDLARFQDDRYLEFLRAFYRQKYANRRIDLVIAVMGPALDFLLQYGAELFPETPTVFCGVSRQEIEGRELGPNVTGVLMQRQFKGTLDLALKLQPATRQVVAIAGTASFNKYWEAIARQEFREYEGRLAFTYLTHHSTQEILQEVVHLPQYTIILYSPICFKDSVGIMFMPDEAVLRRHLPGRQRSGLWFRRAVGARHCRWYLFSSDLHGQRRRWRGCAFWLGRSLRRCRWSQRERTPICSTGASCSGGGSARTGFRPAASCVQSTIHVGAVPGDIIGSSPPCGVEALLIIGLRRPGSARNVGRSSRRSRPATHADPKPGRTLAYRPGG